MHVCMNEYMYVCNEYNRRENKRKEMYKPISSLRSMGGRKNEHKKKVAQRGRKNFSFCQVGFFAFNCCN
jgi:hypothetical protein